MKEMEGNSGEERFLNPDGSSGEEESGGEADYQLSLLCFQPITNLGTFSPLMLSLLRSKLSLARMAAIASSLAPGCHPCPDPLSNLLFTQESEAGFPGGPVVKDLSYNARDTGPIPDLGRHHMLWSNRAQELE